MRNRSIDVAMAQVREQTIDIDLNPKGGHIFGNWSIWSDGQVVIGNTNGSSLSSNQNSDSSVITLGLDKPYGSNGVFGIALGLGQDDINIGDTGSQLTSDNFSLSIYSSRQLSSSLPIETQLGFGKMKMHTRRVEDSITHTGNRDVNMVFGSAAIIGESISKRNFQIKPYGRLEAAHIQFDEFSESGSHLALRFKRQDLNRKIISIGFDVEYPIPIRSWQITPFVKVKYSRDFTGDSYVDMNYINDSQNYRLVIGKASDSAWNTGGGIEFYKNNAFTAYLAYDHEKAGNSLSSDSYQLQINWQF